MSDPVEVLRPARAAEWTTALREAAAGVPGAGRAAAPPPPWSQPSALNSTRVAAHRIVATLSHLDHQVSGL